mmetsp:Transcript_5016/g.11059  ORF Transcript_5016/g.11059 Transcript_5016/m.11059 type:complete len:275 (+) Transcript_5016:430-1254(+)
MHALFPPPPPALAAHRPPPPTTAISPRRRSVPPPTLRHHRRIHHAGRTCHRRGCKRVGTAFSTIFRYRRRTGSTGSTAPTAATVVITNAIITANAANTTPNANTNTTPTPTPTPPPFRHRHSHHHRQRQPRTMTVPPQYYMYTHGDNKATISHARTGQQPRRPWYYLHDAHDIGEAHARTQPRPRSFSVSRCYSRHPFRHPCRRSRCYFNDRSHCSLLSGWASSWTRAWVLGVGCPRARRHRQRGRVVPIRLHAPAFRGGRRGRATRAQGAVGC